MENKRSSFGARTALGVAIALGASTIQLPAASAVPGETFTPVTASVSSEVRSVDISSAVARYSATVTLFPGDRGHGVRAVQKRLKARGYRISVDGRFGPGTARTVAAFQRNSGLAADSIVGPATQRKLGVSVRTLRRGDGGRAVKILQRDLNRNGASLDLDGRFGKGVERAVRVFQSDRGLSVDGLAGPATRRALTSASSGAVANRCQEINSVIDVRVARTVVHRLHHTSLACFDAKGVIKPDTIKRQLRGEDVGIGKIQPWDTIDVKQRELLGNGELVGEFYLNKCLKVPGGIDVGGCQTVLRVTSTQHFVSGKGFVKSSSRYDNNLLDTMNIKGTRSIRFI